MFNSSNSLTPSSSSNSLTHLMQSIFSYNGNIMLAALVSLLFVILFVLVLHIYAKWFLSQARHRRRSSVTVSHILGPNRFPHFNSLVVDSTFSCTPTKGLDPSVINSLPLFIYETEKAKGNGLECVICLSAFEDSEIGRSLPMCSHAFHIECIDMWLGSHTNCPICRAAVVGVVESSDGKLTDGLLEIVTDGQNCESEIHSRANESSSPASSSSSTSSSSNNSSTESSGSSFGCSLKRMLSRNRSESKVFSSSSSNRSNA